MEDQGRGASAAAATIEDDVVDADLRSCVYVSLNMLRWLRDCIHDGDLGAELDVIADPDDLFGMLKHYSYAHPPPQRGGGWILENHSLSS